MLLSTSDGEGFPNTFLQSWASGTPVVSLMIDPDSVIERVGLGVVSGRIEDIGKDISVLMESANLLEEMAKRTRKYIIAHHSEQVVVTLLNHALGSSSHD